MDALLLRHAVQNRSNNNPAYPENKGTAQRPGKERRELRRHYTPPHEKPEEKMMAEKRGLAIKSIKIKVLTPIMSMGDDEVNTY